MDITVEADTLDDAHRELLARTPNGEFVLSKTIESDGQPVTIRSSAATPQEAYAKAESLVPEGATILERREVQAHRRRTTEVEAVDETSAGQIALQHAPEGATVGSVNVAQPGSRGFLGFGRRVTRWRVTLDEPAVVEVRHRSKARISARTGSRPESWRALATAMQALADTSPSHRALAKAWPYQFEFLALTGFDHPTSFLDLPLSTITPAIVDRALQYIELRHAPSPTLAIAGVELRADRYQNIGAGRIGKVVNLVTDSAIVTTSSCLPRSKISILDVEGIGRYAFEAIQHYAAIPVVNFCFRLPHAERIIQTAIQAKPSVLILDPIADRIEVYKGTEALMLEIWEELQEGQVITDERMALKAQAILAAPVKAAPPDAPAPAPQKTKEQRVPEAIIHNYAHGVQEALQVASSPAPPALGTPLATLTGHTDEVWGVAWSPDGRRLASASPDQTVRLWDATSGQPLATLTGHTGRVGAVAWSPDGRRLASAGYDPKVRLWDATSGQPLAILTGHTAVVGAVAWSPDGRRLASASLDQTVRLWDAESGQSLAVLTDHTNGMWAVAWSPDGRRLASASLDQTVRLWDAESFRPLATLTGHSDWVCGVAWSPDGRRLASASHDQTVRLWDGASGQPLAILTGHTDKVHAVAWSPDGRRLASASHDQTVRLWDGASGQPLATLSGHANPVNAVAWSPDGRRLASASDDQTVRLWWVLAAPVEPAPVEPAPVERLTDSRPAVVGVVGTEHGGHDKRVAPVQRVFVCRGAYRGKEGLYLVDGEGKVAEELAHPAPDEWFDHVAVSPDGRWVAYTCYVRRRADRDLYPTIRAVPAVGGKSSDLEHWDPRYEQCYQNPVFSPTGEKMVCEFALQHPGNPDLQVLKLYNWGDQLEGSWTGLSIINPMRIGNHAPQFMPDGERIVYFGNFAYEDLLEVCLYDPSAAEHELLGEVGWRLTENADGVWHRPRAIAVQPEWEQIFFIQGHTRSTERICVFLLSDLSPGTHRKIFDAIGKEHKRIGALEMSRDGRYLAYDGDGAIYVVDADGGNLRRVSPEGIDCKCPQFSEDGAQLAYVGDGKLYTSYRDGDSSVKLTGAELRVDAFVWK